MTIGLQPHVGVIFSQLGCDYDNVTVARKGNWSMVLPYAIHRMSGWLLWLVSCRVDTCHGATATLPFEPGRGQGQGKKRKQFQFASLERLGVVSADGLSSQARKRTSSISSLCVGFVQNLNLTKCKILCTLKTDWLLILEWIWMEILFTTLPSPPACWCSVNKRKIIKM